MEEILNIREEIEEVEEIENVLNINNDIIPRIKIYLERLNPLEIYGDIEFRKKYRMSKQTARFIIDLVRDDIVPAHGNRGLPVSSEIQVLCTIRYLAKGAYQDDVSESHGFHQSTLSRIIKRVVESLARQSRRFIYLPRTRDKNHQVKQDFFQLGGCPQIIGAIDGTHIKIKNPGGEYPLLYLNRKGYYSLNVQVVSDAHCRIQHIIARYRGSAHDSRIWDECNLKTQLHNGELDGLFLGDNGYPCTNRLLTPLLNPITDSERRYNRAHIRTRNVVERLFGIWKNKFRCFFNGMQINLETAKTAIVALAVLHNICRNENEDNDSDHNDDNEMEIGDNIHIQDNVAGAVFRRQYIRQHF